MEARRQVLQEDILGFYLNTVPFGRGTHGVEAAAQAFFGKTVRKSAPAAQQLTVSEAMLLVAMVKQPEPDPNDPVGSPGYDPTRGGKAIDNAHERWTYVKNNMVALTYLTQAQADALVFPTDVKKYDPKAFASNLDSPVGLVVLTRPVRAEAERQVQGGTAGLHRKWWLPDRHHGEQGGRGRRDPGGRHPQPDGTGHRPQPARRLADRTGRGRTGYRTGAGLLRRAQLDRWRGGLRRLLLRRRRGGHRLRRASGRVVVQGVRPARRVARTASPCSRTGTRRR